MSLSLPRETPIKALVFTPNLVLRHVIEGWTSLSMTLRLDATSTATLVVPMAGPGGDIIDGERIVFLDDKDNTIMSGVARPVERERTRNGGGLVTITVEGDNRLLQRILGWVQPTKGIDQQASDDTSAQWKMTGPAETVAKALFSQNAARQGLAVRTLPDQRRGGTISVGIRMQPLADELFPAVTQAGIGIRIEQVQKTLGGWELVMDCWTLPTRPQVLTFDFAAVTSMKLTERGPDAIRAVVGGQGSGNARVFRAGVNQAALSRYGATYGGEVFNDSRRESTVTGLDKALADELAAKDRATSLSLSFMSVGRWQYGKAWRLGDIIQAQFDDSTPPSKTPIVSVSISDNGDGGMVVSATADTTSTPLSARAAKRLAQQTRRLEAGA